MTKRNLLALFSLSLIWGISNILSAFALDLGSNKGNFGFLAWSSLLGLLGFLMIAFLKKLRVLPSPSSLIKLFIVGATIVSLPTLVLQLVGSSVEGDLIAPILGAIPLFICILSLALIQNNGNALAAIAGVAIGTLGFLILFAPTMGVDIQFYRFADNGIARTADQVVEIFAGLLSLISENSFLALVGLLLSALMVAASFVLAYKAMPDNSPGQIAFASLAASVLVFAIASMLVPRMTPPPGSYAYFPILLWQGLVSFGVGIPLLFSLIRSIGPIRASFVYFISPVLGMFLGFLFLADTLDAQAFLLGISLITIGYILVNLGSRRQGQEVAEG